MSQLSLSPAPAPVKSVLLRPQVGMLYPPRPGFGTLGKKTAIWANHFRVTLKPGQGDVYHYDATFAPEGKIPTADLPPKDLCARVLQALVTLLKTEVPGVAVVSDGRRNLYTASQLPFAEKMLQVVLVEDERPRPFDVYIKAADPLAVRMEQIAALFAGRLNYTPYDALQALDVAARYAASIKYTAVGRNFYSSLNAPSLGEGAEMWYGYHQSLRPTQSQLTLNIDMAATAFVTSMPAIDFMCETCNFREIPAMLNKPQASLVAKMFRGVKIQIVHRGTLKMKARVLGLSPKSALETTFFSDELNRDETIVSFFKRKYNISLKYPKLPCLHVGNPSKKIYLPLEVCMTMEGQRFVRKVNENQVANMIRFTCTPPEERRQRIEAQVRAAHFEADNNLAAFGLEVAPQMLSVEARQLPEPDMAYGKNQSERPGGGTWNMRNKAYFAPHALSSCAVISLCDDRRLSEGEIADFFAALLGQAKDLGMGTPGMPPILIRRGRNEPVEDLFYDAVQAATKRFRAPPQIVFCINPVLDAQNYGDLKRASDVSFGIPSQCMLMKHIAKKNPQYIANLLLKVNVKLGGINTVCRDPLPKFSQAPTIIFGADVTHPAPMDKTRPSIAAVVASMDRHAVKYASVMKDQGHRIEQIEDLESLAADMLRSFFQETRVKPARILFYRDGVSEGQFQMVMDYEVTALRRACHNLEPGYNPQITFVIVQKRHNTRFFAANAADADRSGNVKAGTVVDTGVCHPLEHDFYLMSHAGLQGTSRPAHYHVLLDEIGFTADEIQTLTFRLCFTFARCTRSVSIVPAAYYSHLVAFRARFFQTDGSDTGSSAGSSYNEATGRLLEVHQDLRRRMYFV
ncbi:Argonaute1 (AGO1) [Achlya hypogyna]|uniref:Argonaute1 (AGO1) n=1 Tax=Achlya hypogyna TaxID=1202772 RepID=A0A1V9Z6F9_ACHHY|nr:Argonaute1 (AGO1) [Achlya hypogyna]